NGAARPMLRTNSPAGRAHVLTQTTPQAAIVISHDDPAPQSADGERDGGRGHEGHGGRRGPVVTAVRALLVLLVVGGGYAGGHSTMSGPAGGRSSSSAASMGRSPGYTCPTSSSGPASRWRRCLSPISRPSRTRPRPAA